MPGLHGARVMRAITAISLSRSAAECAGPSLSSIVEGAAARDRRCLYRYWLLPTAEPCRRGRFVTAQGSLICDRLRLEDRHADLRINLPHQAKSCCCKQARKILV